MNENIERVLDELDYFRVADEMTYYAYSRLHDLISELDDLLKAQEPKPIENSIQVGAHLMGKCPKCRKVLTIQDHPAFCGCCGQAVKWK